MHNHHHCDENKIISDSLTSDSLDILTMKKKIGSLEKKSFWAFYVYKSPTSEFELKGAVGRLRDFIWKCSAWKVSDENSLSIWVCKKRPEVDFQALPFSETCLLLELVEKLSQSHRKKAQKRPFLEILSCLSKYFLGPIQTIFNPEQHGSYLFKIGSTKLGHFWQNFRIVTVNFATDFNNKYHSEEARAFLWCLLERILENPKIGPNSA